MSKVSFWLQRKGKLWLYLDTVGFTAYVAMVISALLGWRQIDVLFAVASFFGGLVLAALIQDVTRLLEQRLRDSGIDPDDL